MAMSNSKFTHSDEEEQDNYEEVNGCGDTALPTDDYLAMYEKAREDALERSRSEYEDIINKYTCLAHGLTPPATKRHKKMRNKNPRRAQLLNYLEKHTPLKMADIEKITDRNTPLKVLCNESMKKLQKNTPEQDLPKETVIFKEVQETLKKRKLELGLPVDLELKEVDDEVVYWRSRKKSKNISDDNCRINSREKEEYNNSDKRMSLRNEREITTGTTGSYTYNLRKRKKNFDGFEPLQYTPNTSTAALNSTGTTTTDITTTTITTTTTADDKSYNGSNNTNIQINYDYKKIIDDMENFLANKTIYSKAKRKPRVKHLFMISSSQILGLTDTLDSIVLPVKQKLQVNQTIDDCSKRTKQDDEGEILQSQKKRPQKEGKSNELKKQKVCRENKRPQSRRGESKIESQSNKLKKQKVCNEDEIPQSRRGRPKKESKNNEVEEQEEKEKTVETLPPPSQTLTLPPSPTTTLSPSPTTKSPPSPTTPLPPSPATTTTPPPPPTSLPQPQPSSSPTTTTTTTLPQLPALKTTVTHSDEDAIFLKQKFRANKKMPKERGVIFDLSKFRRKRKIDNEREKALSKPCEDMFMEESNQNGFEGFEQSNFDSGDINIPENKKLKGDNNTDLEIENEANSKTIEKSLDSNIESTINSDLNKKNETKKLDNLKPSIDREQIRSLKKSQSENLVDISSSGVENQSASSPSPQCHKVWPQTDDHKRDSSIHSQVSQFSKGRMQKNSQQNKKQKMDGLKILFRRDKINDKCPESNMRSHGESVLPIYTIKRIVKDRQTDSPLKPVNDMKHSKKSLSPKYNITGIRTGKKIPVHTSRCTDILTNGHTHTIQNASNSNDVSPNGDIRNHKESLSPKYTKPIKSILINRQTNTQTSNSMNGTSDDDISHRREDNEGKKKKGNNGNDEHKYETTNTPSKNIYIEPKGDTKHGQNNGRKDGEEKSRTLENNYDYKKRKIGGLQLTIKRMNGGWKTTANGTRERMNKKGETTNDDYDSDDDKYKTLQIDSSSVIIASHHQSLRNLSKTYQTMCNSQVEQSRTQEFSISQPSMTSLTTAKKPSRSFWEISSDEDEVSESRGSQHTSPTLSQHERKSSKLSSVYRNNSSNCPSYSQLGPKKWLESFNKMKKDKKPLLLLAPSTIPGKKKR